jgi:hypothetical protein
VRDIHRIILMAACLLLFPSPANAQDPWTQKPFRQWTKDDIIKIAGDSPWAHLKEATPAIGDWVPTSYLPAVTIRLRSALPIRQALVRLKQLEAKYDKMGEKERAAFDLKARGLLECPACSENYVISLGPPISKREMKSGMGPLKHAILSQLEKRVYLMNELGERRELVHFVAPKHDEDEAMFFFPRLDENGKPLLSPENKKLIFIFEAKNIRTGYGLDSVPERFEFNVAKMIVDGRVEF